MHVVATAGHVDHGKSTLVRALTGQDPDRLAEERRRGLTIELGYCWTRLGDDDVCFVDVPGHERFVATALAGVGPVPVAMLVVAADDPWMPQADEHLNALDALGVEHGVLVVTRADLADPAPALAAARDRVASTSLARVPDVTVSGRTGAGLGTLREVLTHVLDGVPSPPPDADVRLWVDRAFTIRGVGPVVTGTLTAGRLQVGDQLESDGALVRVRRLECLGAPVEAVTGVARAAVALGGRDAPTVRRGSALVTPRAFLASSVVDVRLDRDEPPPRRPILHVGAAATSVHVRPLAPGIVRLRTERSLPLRIGDRALVRDPGSRRLWGATVLDPAPAPLTRRGEAARVAALLEAASGTVAGELSRRGLARKEDLGRLGAREGPLPAGTIARDGWLVSADRAGLLRQRLTTLVAERPPERPGLTAEEAARRLELPDPRLVVHLLEPPLRLHDGRIVTGTGGTVLSATQEATLDRVRNQLAGAGIAAPEAGSLAGLGLDPATMAALHRAGGLVRLADKVVVLPDVPHTAVRLLEELPQPFTTSAARRAWGTSRRLALPLLEHLDRTGHTVRMADDRRRLRRVGPSSGDRSDRADLANSEEAEPVPHSCPETRVDDE